MTNQIFGRIELLSRQLYASEHAASSLEDNKLKLIWESLSEETRLLYQEEACLRYVQDFTTELPKQIYEYQHPLGKRWIELKDQDKATYINLVKDLGLLSYNTPATMEAAPSLPKGTV